MLVAQSCLTLGDLMDCGLPGSSAHGDSLGKNTRVGCHFLLQGIFPTQGLNPGLLNCRWILYHLSHQGSPRILEWVAYLFSKGTSWPRNWTGVSCIAGIFFTSWASNEAPSKEQLREKTLMLGKIEGKRRRERQRMRWLDSITDSMDMNLSKPREIVKDRGAWRAVVHGGAESGRT